MRSCLGVKRNDNVIWFSSSIDVEYLLASSVARELAPEIIAVPDRIGRRSNRNDNNESCHMIMFLP